MIDSMHIISNGQEYAPEIYYVFINTYNWITRHNLQFTKGITSASISEIIANEELRKKYLDGSIDYLQFVPNQDADIHSSSLYSLTATRDYRIEYNSELFRRSHDISRLSPSRLSCIYAFGDFESCKQVANLYGWDINSVKKFRLIENPLTRIAKVNMEVISLLRNADLVTFDPQKQERIWHHYWSGMGNLEIQLPVNGGPEYSIESSGVLWEYLIEGRLELI